MNASLESRSPDATAPIAGLASVGLVVYNGRKDVAAAIDSVLAQTYSPLELVVVDDGSTDGTWELLQSYGDRIVAVRQPNGGLPVARNTALRHCRGEFIALMDHDDLCRPERIAVQVAFLQRHPEVGMCCSDFAAFGDRGPIEASYIGSYYSQCSPAAGGVRARYPQAAELDLAAYLGNAGPEPRVAPVYFGPVYEALAFGNFVHPPTIMVRASVAREAGTFDVEARNTCDWDWIVRIARIASIGHIHRPLLDYRLSPGQMSGLQHRATGNIATLWVAERIFERDPALAPRHGRAVSRMLGEMAVDVAYANAERNPATASAALGRALLRYGYFNMLGLRTLAKLLLPTGLLRRASANRKAAA